MTLGQIINLAREAGYTKVIEEHDAILLTRFAILVAAAEREACAKACEERIAYWYRGDDRRDEDANCAAAIRARSEP